jgi:transposase
MIRVQLTLKIRGDVERLRRAAATPVPVRARCPLVLLSADGWSAPCIAANLAYHPHTVRAVLRRSTERGLPGLTPNAPGPLPDTARRAQVTTALDRLLATDPAWTAAQLAAALGEAGIALSTRSAGRCKISGSPAAP